MKTFKLHLIRHGLTSGNLQGLYIGSGTDIPLCDEGRAQLAELKERFSHAKGGGQEEALHGKEKEYGAEEQEGGVLGSSEPGEEPAPKGADVPEQTWENPLA